MTKDQEKIVLQYIADKEELRGLTNQLIAAKTGASFKAVKAIANGHKPPVSITPECEAATRKLTERRQVLEGRSRYCDLSGRLEVCEATTKKWIKIYRFGPKPGQSLNAALAMAEVTTQQRSFTDIANRWLTGQPLRSQEVQNATGIH